MICPKCKLDVVGSVCWQCAEQPEPEPTVVRLSDQQQIVADLQAARARPPWRPDSWTVRKPLSPFLRFCWNDQTHGPPPDYELYEVRRGDGAKRFLGYEFD